MSLAPGVEQDAVRPHAVEDEGGRGGGALDQRRLAEDLARHGEAGDGDAVPVGEDLVVGERPVAPEAGFEELRGERLDVADQVGGGHAAPLGRRLQPLGLVEDVEAVLEERRAAEAEEGGEEGGVLLPEHLGDVLAGPDVVGALVAVGLGVDGAPEGALGRGHLAGDPARGLAHDAGRLRIAGAGVLAGEELQEEAVVVEHLLEVGHLPLAVGGVAVEAAAELVVDAAASHLVESGGEHLAGLGVLGGHLHTEIEVGRGRELGRAAEAAPLAVEAAAEGGEGALGDLGIGGRGRGVGALLQKAAHGVRHLLRLHVDLLAAPLPGLGQRFENAPEAVTAVLVLGREVGAGVEGLEVGGEEDRVGPSPLAGEDLGGGHVDLVEVGALLAVHLDVDEVAVHDLGDLGGGEGLALHDVAPVAGRVADGEEDGLVLGAGLL